MLTKESNEFIKGLKPKMKPKDLLDKHDLIGEEDKRLVEVLFN